METFRQKTVLILSGLVFLMSQSFGLPVEKKENENKELTIDETLMRTNENADPNIASDSTERVYLTELDIAQTEEQYEALHNTGHQKRGVGLRNESYRWPNQTVKYTISPNTYTAADIKKIKNAMAEISHYTCIKFEKATKSDIRPLNIVSGRGCWSWAGRISKIQKLSFDKSRCISHGVMVHEMLHTLGLYHEHSRPDRDNYITIDYANIEDYYKNMFRKENTTLLNTFGLPYDYRSIMHYGRKYYSKNRKTTVITKDSAYQDMIGQRKGLSFLDVRTINRMYKCRPANCTKTDADCPKGFLGQDCRCWCPMPSVYHPIEYCRKSDIKTYGSLKFVPS